MDDYAWLQGLKPGDAVIVVGLHDRRTVQKVQRVTPTQIVLGEYTRFHKKNGEEVGGTMWSRQCLAQPTPQAVAEIQQQALRNKHTRAIQTANLKSLTDNQLERIAAILAETKD